MFSQEIKDEISKRTKAALAAKKARGEQVGNPEIYKYSTGDVSKANQVRFSQAKERNERIMIAIEEAKNQGHKSLREIARHLNLSDYKTSRGKYFTAMSVKLIIDRYGASR